MEIIEKEFERIIGNLGIDTIEIVVLVVVGVLFLSFLLLKIFVRSFENKGTELFLLSTFCISLLYRYALIVFEKSVSVFILLLAIICLLAIPIKCVGKKPKKQDESKEFIKFIDEKIAEQEKKPIINDMEIVEPIEEEKSETVDGLNLSHVKNILNRLDYFNLSQADRRQVRELETVVFQAERHFDDLEIKEKLNDGLGALLKIMAKYGV